MSVAGSVPRLLAAVQRFRRPGQSDQASEAFGAVAAIRYEGDSVRSTRRFARSPGVCTPTSPAPAPRWRSRSAGGRSSRSTRPTLRASPGSSATPPAPSAPAAHRGKPVLPLRRDRACPTLVGAGCRARVSDPQEERRAPGRPSGRRGTRAGGRNSEACTGTGAATRAASAGPSPRCAAAPSRPRGGRGRPRRRKPRCRARHRRPRPREAPKRTSIECRERIQPSCAIQPNSTLRTPSRAAGYSGPSGVPAATRSARSSRRQTCSTWPGWCSVPSGFALRSGRFGPVAVRRAPGPCHRA